LIVNFCTQVQLPAGTQPVFYFEEGNFHEISFDDVIVLVQPW